MSDDEQLAVLRGRIRGLEQQLSIANERASFAMRERRRLSDWFLSYPSHPSRSRTMYELERDEQTALGDMAHLWQQLAHARQELDALYQPSLP